MDAIFLFGEIVIANLSISRFIFAEVPNRKRHKGVDLPP